MKHELRLDLLRKVRELISDCGGTFEDIYSYDDYPHAIGVNFLTERHEYTVVLHDARDGVSITCNVWHGNGEVDIFNGPDTPQTWASIKKAIERKDRECEEFHFSYQDARLTRLSDYIEGRYPTHFERCGAFYELTGRRSIL